MISKTTLSVRLMVYNNLPYIQQALDGVLMQHTNFKYEVLIGDDFSTDGTLAILETYQKKHPDLIKILDRPKDGVYAEARKKLGRIHNFVDIVNHCQGKYIAILDGDDYWTDPLKLQKQVDFLEANSDFSICYHPTTELFEDGTTKLTNAKEPDEYDAAYLLEKGWHIRSVSVVFRKSDLPQWPKWVYQIESMDYVTQCLLTKNGQKIKCIKENMGVYRIHQNNVSSKINKDYKTILERSLVLLKLIKAEFNDTKYLARIDQRIITTQTNYFYELRNATNKKLSHYIRIAILAIQLNKIQKIFNLSKWAS